MMATERRQIGGQVRPMLGMVAWVATLGAVAVGGRALGRGALAPPALTDPASWAGWAQGRTPVEAAFAVLTVVVVALAWYLLAATALVVTARLRGTGRLVSVAEVLTVPMLRRTVHAVLGVGLFGTSVASAAAAPPPRQAVLAELLMATATDEASAAEDDHVADEGAPVMRLLPEEESSTAPTTERRPPTGPPASEAPGTDVPAAGVPATEPQVLPASLEVRPGDHLWSLAAQILDEAGGRATDHEIATYWRQLIEANRDRLADPANPDLIFPGQVLAVPAPAGATSSQR